MKKWIYSFLFLSIGLFFSCEKSDFAPELNPEFAMLTVQVTDAASHTAYQCGGPDAYQNVQVSLFWSEEERRDGINPVASKITQSRGGVTFTKLEGGTYYISVRSASINADRKVTIRKGEVKRMNVAVTPSVSTSAESSTGG